MAVPLVTALREGVKRGAVAAAPHLACRATKPHFGVEQPIVSGRLVRMENVNPPGSATRPDAGKDPMESGPTRVLVVEDEMVVAMLVEDMLNDLGYEVAGVASRVDEALNAIETSPVDLAILDVHLNGRAVFPVADSLLAHNIPFVFATAYGERGVPEKYRRGPILQKPFFTQELQRALATVRSPESP